VRARLEHKIAVVTGAGGGIGAACAVSLAAAGAAVLLADRNVATAQERVAAITAAGGVAAATSFDAAAGDEMFESLFTTAADAFGGVDILVNNAVGVRAPENPGGNLFAHRIEELDEGWFDAMLHGTATATMLGIKHAVPHMRARGGGSIVNMASISGLRGEIYLPAYGAGKAAVIQLTRTAAATYGREGIRCNAICPGLILTESGKVAYDGRVMAAWKRHTPTGRLGEPEDVGPLAVFLASDESRHMTGQALVVDGGFTMHEPTWADRLDLSS